MEYSKALFKNLRSITIVCFYGVNLLLCTKNNLFVKKKGFKQSLVLFSPQCYNKFNNLNSRWIGNAYMILIVKF